MDDNKIEKQEFMNMSFLKKMWYSISKFEKYPEMAALGVKKSLIYFTQLMAIFCIIYTIINLYYTFNIAQFEIENLSPSGKIIIELINKSNLQLDSEYINQSIEYMQNIPIITMVVTLFISIFISIFFNTLADIFLLSFFGLVTSLLSKISIRYKAIFNMSIYALTLSVILRLVYLVSNLIFDFKIKYFDVMYISVAYISLAAAIFMIKSDLIKQHIQLIKIMEESKQKIEEKINFPEKEKNKENDKEENEKESEKGKKQEKNNDGSTSEKQGANA